MLLLKQLLFEYLITYPLNSLALLICIQAAAQIAIILLMSAPYYVICPFINVHRVICKLLFTWFKSY